ncbi:hypothetical protein L226DRAFT_540750 [Lentinus tigrinus ALCF2SS1-7]|uniref:uncharacterized protein n=1 Tax=Lentinus tigrinus ALCF2SS1-7 TaxID=1328758 RepID=UPI00116623C5|nr:hypothetical protein L226DRAFT_540750 [Lentinus tigrinus ALCF2SS1-7]
MHPSTTPCSAPLMSPTQEPTQLPPLPGNCVTSLTIDGLVTAIDSTSGHGDAVPLTLTLARSPPGEPRQKHHGYVPEGTGYMGYYLVPEMPAANQPVPPRPDQPRVRLHLRVGELIAANERHVVYDVDVDVDVEVTEVVRAADSALRGESESEDDEDTSGSRCCYYIPPLVIKAAQTDEAGALLSKEAAMYEHIQALQGVVAPRFYGYFHCVPAANTDSESKWTRLPTSEPPASYGWDDVDDEENCPFPADGSDVRPPAPEGPPPCTRVDVLLLEKVGGRLPPGQMPDKLLIDLRRMYHDLSSLHVDHFDYRPANVAYAPLSPPGLPGLPSPFRKSGKCVYGLRLVDFEGAQITTRTPLYQRKLIKERLPGLIWGIMAAS